MNIAVFVKQVPDTSEVKINPETGTLIRAGVPSIINPYDHFALHAAIGVKRATGCKVTVVCMMGELERYHGIQVEKLFEEKRKFELLVSLISDPIIFCNFSGELIYANAPAMEILRGGEELDDSAMRDRIAEFVKKQSLARDSGLEINVGGQKKYFSANMQPVALKTEAPAVFITLHDVTLERDVQRVKEDFFNSAAHDLRAPLLSMQGYIKLLGYDLEDGTRQSGYLKNIDESGRRLFKLIENMLDFSRLDSGSFSMKAVGGLSLFRAVNLLYASITVGAMTVEALKGTPVAFDRRIHELKPHSGQLEVAERLRALLDNSGIRASHATGDPRVQDPYCLGCMPFRRNSAETPTRICLTWRKKYCLP